MYYLPFFKVTQQIMNSITGNITDIINKKIFWGRVEYEAGKINSIKELGPEKPAEAYILPGFTDSHIHIESSMLVPSEFAKLAVIHGTVATVSDPHEIANVCGLPGVDYMINNGKTIPFKFHFGAPSCVPATKFETAGAELSSTDIEALMGRDDIYYLSEMMNFPGVLHKDEEVVKKIAIAHKYKKPVDGHAPGLNGKEAEDYILAGISTDHECFTEEEAAFKLSKGMKILIREGSAAKNFEALIPLLEEHFNEMMFCSDDKHPDSLLEGHINILCQRAVAKGIDVFKVLKAACVNPVLHYNLTNGLLREGDAADFIVVNNLKEFKVSQTFIDGMLVAENGKSFIETKPDHEINNFNCSEKTADDFTMPATESKTVFAIEALDGQLITRKLKVTPPQENGFFCSDPENDLIKLAVVNRYNDAPVSLAFIKNTGIKDGAIASTVAHDSHNIVVAGTNDKDICRAVNLLIEAKGGVSAVNFNEEKVLALPVAGLMSLQDGAIVAASYTEIDRFVKEELGSTLSSPFMTLSFMALPVIPNLKLTDKGLFDVDSFSFVHN